MAVRQMGADREKLDDRIQHKPRDILSDYTQYDSEVYAPIARHGVFPDRGSGGFSNSSLSDWITNQSPESNFENLSKNNSMSNLNILTHMKVCAS